MSEPNHARRFGVIWVVSTLIATPLVIVLLGPILPPGNGSEQASDQASTTRSCWRWPRRSCC